MDEMENMSGSRVPVVAGEEMGDSTPTIGTTDIL